MSKSTGNQKGSIEVICGPMFSGKTEELLRRLKRAKIAQIPYAIFKPEVDKRYSETHIVSHDANYFPSFIISDPKTIMKQSQEAAIVAIDEAQFLDLSITDIAVELASQGKRVIAAGLDMDYLGKPFGCMPYLMAVADKIDKFNSVCMVCGGDANYTYRKTADKNLVLTGALDIYEPRCRNCFSLA
jgi:thymidine kinase